MPRKKSTKSTAYDQGAHDRHLAEIRRQETCDGCGTHYPGTYGGNGPRKIGIGDGTPGGRWIYDCCNPDWLDDELKGEDDECTA